MAPLRTFHVCRGIQIQRYFQPCASLARVAEPVGLKGLIRNRPQVLKLSIDSFEESVDVVASAAVQVGQFPIGHYIRTRFQSCSETLMQEEGTIVSFLVRVCRERQTLAA